MRNGFARCVTLVVAWLALAAHPAFADVVATDLGTLGGSTSQAMAINAVGWIAGASDTPGDASYHAFLWTPGGGMVDVGAPSGAYSYAVGVSDTGLVAGNVYGPMGPGEHAFAWTGDGGMIEIGLGGPQSRASASNAAGQIVGYARTPGGAEQHAFSWTPSGGVVDLGTLGGTWGIAWGVSNAGHVVGGSTTAGDDYGHAFVWTPGSGMVDLGTGGVDTSSVAKAVNVAGWVAGYIGPGWWYHAVVWTPEGQMIDLGTLGGMFSVATAISESGRVIGYSTLTPGDSTTTHAFSWTAGEGMIDLGTLGGSTAFASAVNASGQVAGMSRTQGDASVHAFLWTREGGMVDLGAAGRTDSIALALNDAGVAVGDAWNADPAILNDHAMSWRIAPAAGYTAPGSDVPVSPTDPADPGAPQPIELVFDTVSSGGTTTVTTTVEGPPPPTGFTLGDTAVYYDVETTAEYSGLVTVCLAYADLGGADESGLRLVHHWDPIACAGKAPGVDASFDYSQPGWEQVTDPGYPDAVNNVICGTVTCLSPFAVARSLEISGPVSPVPVSTAITLTAPFNGEATATWEFGDGTTATSSVPSGGDAWVGTHAYGSAGVYTAGITLRTAAGQIVGEAQYRFVVVYDPAAGFVTGGGWIQSPAGAYPWNPALAGKATFGFVAKYQKGAITPAGTTEFQFKAGELNFRSTSYDWLVVSGAKAQFKGTGTVDGEGLYRFMLTAIDGDASASDAFPGDRFRIRIWIESGGAELVVYDNALGDGSDAGTTEIGGGAIAIHR